MPQNKSHLLRFLVYDQEATPFWAVVSIANFRGEGDEENMTLSNVSGTTGRQRPKELLGHIEGLISTDPQPTKDAPRSKPKDLLNSTPTTQDLLKDLQAVTQATTPKAARPNTPESGGSKGSRATLAGKAPRAQSATQPFRRQAYRTGFLIGRRERRRIGGG